MMYRRHNGSGHGYDRCKYIKTDTSVKAAVWTWVTTSVRGMRIGWAVLGTTTSADIAASYVQQASRTAILNQWAVTTTQWAPELMVLPWYWLDWYLFVFVLWYRNLDNLLSVFKNTHARSNCLIFTILDNIPSDATPLNGLYNHCTTVQPSTKLYLHILNFDS